MKSRNRKKLFGIVNRFLKDGMLYGISSLLSGRVPGRHRARAVIIDFCEAVNVRFLKHLQNLIPICHYSPFVMKLTQRHL